MREAVREAVVGRWPQHGDAAAHLFEQLLRGARRGGIAPTGGRVKIRMQAHVEHRELDLAQHGEAALEILGGQHLVEEFARQRRAALHVARHVPQHVPFPGEVLHELAGKLDCIPLHAVDARDAEVLHAREQVMQPVAELVEQSQHVIVSQQGGAAGVGWQEVANQVGDRQRGS